MAPAVGCDDIVALNATHPKIEAACAGREDLANDGSFRERFPKKEDHRRPRPRVKSYESVTEFEARQTSFDSHDVRLIVGEHGHMSTMSEPERFGRPPWAGVKDKSVRHGDIYTRWTMS